MKYQAHLELSGAYNNNANDNDDEDGNGNEDGDGNENDDDDDNNDAEDDDDDDDNDNSLGQPRLCEKYLTLRNELACKERMRWARHPRTYCSAVFPCMTNNNEGDDDDGGESGSGGGDNRICTLFKEQISRTFLGLLQDSD